MFKKIKFEVMFSLHRTCTPDRCGNAAALLITAAIFGTFFGMSASSTTHSLNMAGGGAGMVFGIMVLVALPWLARWYVKGKVRKGRTQWSERHGISL